MSRSEVIDRELYAEVMQVVCGRKCCGAVERFVAFRHFHDEGVCVGSAGCQGGLDQVYEWLVGGLAWGDGERNERLPLVGRRKRHCRVASLVDQLRQKRAK